MLGFSFGLVSIFNTAMAQVLPAGSETKFTVLNISEDNKDAVSVGASAGDTLRYEFELSSTENDVMGFDLVVDISELLKSADIIDAGTGQVLGEELIFPTFSQSAPCSAKFTFFVRVKPCNGVTTLKTSANGKSLSVGLGCNLMKTGPGSDLQYFFLIFALFLIGTLLISFQSKKQV